MWAAHGEQTVCVEEDELRHVTALAGGIANGINIAYAELTGMIEVEQDILFQCCKDYVSHLIEDKLVNTLGRSQARDQHQSKLTHLA